MDLTYIPDETGFWIILLFAGISFLIIFIIWAIIQRKNSTKVKSTR